MALHSGPICSNNLTYSDVDLVTQYLLRRYNYMTINHYCYSYLIIEMFSGHNDLRNFGVVLSVFSYIDFRKSSGRDLAENDE